jgi:hypothetical protein
MVQRRWVGGKLLCSALLVSTVGCNMAYGINAPEWSEFAKGELIDTANVRVDGDITGAYVKHSGDKKEIGTLYEVDCKTDVIRVHSDTPRYTFTPVEGSSRGVIQSDDGFRTVVPQTRNARIEGAICGIVARQEAEKAKVARQTECENAKKDDTLRVSITDGLTHDQRFCLMGLALSQPRDPECDKAGVLAGTSVVDYLHAKGMFLECEDHPYR